MVECSQKRDKETGEVHETIISGKTSNISQFFEFVWFEWVMFQDKTAAYPNDHFRLGRYLGLSMNVGPVLKAKIIKKNCPVLHRSTYWELTQDEWEQEECKNERSLFMVSLHKVMCHHMMLRDLVDLGVEETLQYDTDEDESQNAETLPMLDEEPEVTPNRGDQYVNAEIVLPRGDMMARGKVVYQKHDADPIRTQYWIHVLIKSNFQGEKWLC